MFHIFQQSENKKINWNLIPCKGTDYRFRIIVFIFHLFLNVEPIIPFSGRLILIKKISYY